MNFLTYAIFFVAMMMSLPMRAQVPESPQVLDSIESNVPAGRLRGIQKPRSTSLSPSKEDEPASSSMPAADSKNQDKYQSGSRLSKPSKASTRKTHGGKEPQEGSAPTGNLPSYALRAVPLEKAQSGIVTPKNGGVGMPLETLHVGDILKCRISQSFKAFENSQIPVRAVITEGALKGGILIGAASMEVKTKVVKISFTEIITPKKELYSFAGGVFSQSAEALEGEYETHYWRYFWSEAILSATAGYAQSTVDRSKNALGQYETDNSAENAAKIGVASGVGTTVKELSERGKNAPEFIKIEGPIFIEVMVLKEGLKRSI